MDASPLGAAMVHLAFALATATLAGPTPPVYVTPATPTGTVGRGLAYTLERVELDGGGLPQPLPWGSAPMDTILLRAANAQTNADLITELVPAGDARGRDATSASISIAPSHPGTNLLGIDLRPWTEKVEAASLRAALTERLAPRSMTRLDGLLPAGEVVIRRIESAKAFVEVGPLTEPDAATATSKTGQPAEIRLLMNPAALQPGSDLPIRVYAAGDKQAGAVVRARVEAAPDRGLPAAVQTCTTDSVGIGHFQLPRAGLYRLDVFHAEPADEGSGAEINLYSATVTFFVHEQGGGALPEEPRP